MPILEYNYTVWIVYTATHLLLELTVLYLSGNNGLTAASTRLPHGKRNLRRTAACIRLSCSVLNACLIPIWKQPSDGRLHTAASRYIEQPPHSRLQTAAWRVKKHLSRNSCLTAFSRRLSCGEFQQKLSGGWYNSGYVHTVCFLTFSEIQHLFYSKENDWGFSTFIPWNVSFFSCDNNLIYFTSCPLLYGYFDRWIKFLAAVLQCGAVQHLRNKTMILFSNYGTLNIFRICWIQRKVITMLRKIPSLCMSMSSLMLLMESGQWKYSLQIILQKRRIRSKPLSRPNKHFYWCLIYTIVFEICGCVFLEWTIMLLNSYIICVSPYLRVVSPYKITSFVYLH